MPFFATELSAIRAQLISEDQPTRLHASLDLLKCVRSHRESLAPAREIAALVIQQRKDAHSVNNALKVVGLIDGPGAAQALRLPLLDDPRPMFVKYIVQAIDDRAEVPNLLQLLIHRREPEIRIAIIRLLGRWKEASAFDAIVGLLEDESLRAHAVEALADLGDSRAIEPLQKYLNDQTDGWEIDNHGPMLRVCDLVKEAIGKMSHKK